jgi:hypothetical protein
MQFALIIYNDPDLMEALPQGEADAMLHTCFTHADNLRRDGRLLDSQMLGEAASAKSVRIRHGRMTALDGPFTEAKEVLGGFNLIEARDIEEAVRIAAEFPWARTGCVEVRPVQNINEVRQRVGASPAPAVEMPSASDAD